MVADEGPSPLTLLLRRVTGGSSSVPLRDYTFGAASVSDRRRTRSRSRVRRDVEGRKRGSGRSPEEGRPRHRGSGGVGPRPHDCCPTRPEWKVSLHLRVPVGKSTISVVGRLDAPLSDRKGSTPDRTSPDPPVTVTTPDPPVTVGKRVSPWVAGRTRDSVYTSSTQLPRWESGNTES